MITILFILLISYVIVNIIYDYFTDKKLEKEYELEQKNNKNGGI